MNILDKIPESLVECIIQFAGGRCYKCFCDEEFKSCIQCNYTLCKNCIIDEEYCIHCSLILNKCICEKPCFMHTLNLPLLCDGCSHMIRNQKKV